MQGPGDVSLIQGPNMTKFAFPSHPLLLGFEPLERLVERTARAGAEGYPPFNIELAAPNRYMITLAVAGFRDEDIAITLEDRQLVIRGQHPEPDDERVFLHRGIATRQFRRVFALAEGVEVTGARLDNGLLVVTLERAEPKSEVRTIPIARQTSRNQTARNQTARK
jgi:HSP20 family molecular chaperone IbpA